MINTILEVTGTVRTLSFWIMIILGVVSIFIIANTIKGEGIDFMADDYHWHYGAVDEAHYQDAKASLEKYYKKRVARAEKEGV